MQGAGIGILCNLCPLLLCQHGCLLSGNSVMAEASDIAVDTHSTPLTPNHCNNQQNREL